MIWVDKVGRGSGGARQIATATIGGQAFTVYEYGDGEIIFSLNQNEQSGTIDILATLTWLQSHGLVGAGARLGTARLRVRDRFHGRRAGEVRGVPIHADQHLRASRRLLRPTRTEHSYGDRRSHRGRP